MENNTKYQEGLYFGLPDEIYHSLPFLSSTFIKKILISPADAWESSWMNTDKEVDEKVQEWRKVGHAYHKRICEGKAAFDAAYCPSFEPPDECLKTVDDMATALTEAGVTFKKTMKKPDYIALCAEHLPDMPIYDLVRATHRAANNGKEELDFKLLKRIEIAAAMIENHPQLKKCFSGGYAEVSVIWKEVQDDGTVLWFKARFDYLKAMAVIDLKTFSNFMGKPIESAIYAAMAAMKYHIQCALYMKAAEKAVEFARIGSVNVLSDPTPTTEWLATLALTEQHAFFHVWQKKDGAPVARGMEFTRGSMFACGQASIERGIDVFKEYTARFGDDIWVDDTDIATYEDLLMPSYAFEI